MALSIYQSSLQSGTKLIINPISNCAYPSVFTKYEEKYFKTNVLIVIQIRLLFIIKFLLCLFFIFYGQFVLLYEFLCPIRITCISNSHICVLYEKNRLTKHTNRIIKRMLHDFLYTNWYNIFETIPVTCYEPTTIYFNTKNYFTKTVYIYK